MAADKFKVVILGGGSGGISVAARLAKKIGANQIAIVEPNQDHFYQPFWTLVGGGIVHKEVTRRPMADVIPQGVVWLKHRVDSVDPKQQLVQLDQGRVHYDYLIVATGLQLDWHKIKGLQGNLGNHGICTIYDYEGSQKAAEMIQQFRRGRAIFVMPPVPIKCAGAPQKIMYLAEEIFRKNGVRDNCEVIFTTNGKAMFGIPVFSQALEKVVKRQGIKPYFQHKLIEVKPEQKIAVYEQTIETTQADGKVAIEKKTVEMPYDLLHVVPTMSAHDYVSRSGLAFADGDQLGWLKVDKHTLQHLDYQNIFGIGDVTGVPNSKTGAAVRKQAPVVVENLLAAMKGQKVSAQYDGYSSCPLITKKGKVILAEFGYDSKLMPTFPLDPTIERSSMWLLKRYILPVLYWYGMLRGRA